LTNEWATLLVGQPHPIVAEQENVERAMEAHKKKMVEFLADHPDKWRLSA
jgi:hypothetical protein